jgi:hypothetical protein
VVTNPEEDEIIDEIDDSKGVIVVNEFNILKKQVKGLEPCVEVERGKAARKRNWLVKAISDSVR